MSIAITEGLVNDWGFEVPGLIHSVREDRAYADGYKYGQRYPEEDTPSFHDGVAPRPPRQPDYGLITYLEDTPK